ncbi:hypothetical protein SAMN05421869_14328 [Nonomuraea jiangxiensis]|uniref:DUF2269 family protein n=1 Tax=Nonomuraea jiangxiensis TaxID=633440 RepID=A0A1G9T1R7_9ACTN|nr:hypothetical protein SAMN05421869_14328 [Nonomuraea jiangxiensis]
MRALLRPRTRKTVLVIHVVASVALLGEVWGLVLLNTAATLTNDPGLAHAAYRLMPVMVFGGGIPFSLIALTTGVVLGLVSQWGLFRYYWTAAKLVLLVAVICAGMFLFDPEGMAAATESASGVPVPASDARQWGQVAVLGTQVAMLMTATVLSIFKPRAKLFDGGPRRGVQGAGGAGEEPGPAVGRARIAPWQRSSAEDVRSTTPSGG